jgi:penicillin-binding protein 2
MNDIDFAPRRKVFFYGLIGFVVVVYFIRLIQLQVVYEEEYGKKSEENSLRAVEHNPLRGYVYDRYGTLIVDNRPSYTVTATPAEFDNSQTGYLADILSMDSAVVASKIAKGKSANRFSAVRVRRDVDFTTLAYLEEHRDRLPGVEYIVESKRFYPTSARAPHLFGYTTEISDARIQAMPDDYKPGDLIGASGLEARYEQYLRGKKGYSIITVNARGEAQGAYNGGASDVPVTEGDDLYLYLDSKLQAVAESLLTGRRGAVVAIDPETGGVLAIVSKPDYDPSLLGGVTPPELWTSLNTDPAKPMFNRATMTRYPPGSTIKMMLAAAALEDRVISPSWGVNCTGVFQFGSRPFRDMHVHGPTDVVESIQKSCNVFYYQLMLKVGLERWNSWGKVFGFGSPTGIDILEENSGLLPSAAYYDRVYGKGKWTQGYLVSLAIGQGELGVSPLQMACYAAALANRGEWHRPSVVSRIRVKATGSWLDHEVQTRHIDVSPNVWRLLRRGMERCVNAEGGTASLARVKDVRVAGKTGTAQNPHGKDHAWFVGFAPVDNPKIAIAVLVENSGYGGTYAAPIAARCIEQFLFGTIADPARPDSSAVVSLQQTTTGN